MTEQDEKNIFARAEEFLQLFKKGAEFTQELMRDNERLRFRVVQLEERLKLLDKRPTSEELIEQQARRIKELEQEMEVLLKRYREVEEENKDFANRYVEIEQENNNLANLYVASYQLHSTMDFKEVLRIILEIIINLIGAEVFGILLLDEKTNELSVVAAEGVDRSEIPPVGVGKGIIGGVAKSGENYFVDEIPAFDTLNPLRPIVCIPLKIKEHLLGVIAIYKLLKQKSRFTELDYELFTLLAGHAATAYSALNYTQSLREGYPPSRGF